MENRGRVDDGGDGVWGVGRIGSRWVAEERD